MKRVLSLLTVIGLAIGFSAGQFAAEAPKAEAVFYGAIPTLNPTCPGGGVPACTACSGTTCIWACAGGFNCYTTRTSCSPSGGSCRTGSGFIFGW